MKAILVAISILSLVAIPLGAAAQPGGGPGGTVKDPKPKDSKDGK